MPAITRGFRLHRLLLLQAAARRLQPRARLPHQLPAWRLQLHMHHLQPCLHLSPQWIPGNRALHRPRFRGSMDPTGYMQQGLLRRKGPSLHMPRSSESTRQKACLRQSQRQGPVKVTCCTSPCLCRVHRLYLTHVWTQRPELQIFFTCCAAVPLMLQS